MKLNEQILARIRSVSLPAVIAVSGFGGSGKSSLAAELGERLGSPIVGVDSFIKDRDMTGAVRWDCIDYERLEHEVLAPWCAGATSVEYGHFDWQANAIGSRRKLWRCRRIIVEGVGLLRPTLRRYFRFSIWVDCPLDEAIRRGKKRDREVYANPQDESWDGVWRRNDEECYRLHCPDQFADLLFDNANPMD